MDIIIIIHRNRLQPVFRRKIEEKKTRRLFLSPSEKDTQDLRKATFDINTEIIPVLRGKRILEAGFATLCFPNFVSMKRGSFLSRWENFPSDRLKRITPRVKFHCSSLIKSVRAPWVSITRELLQNRPTKYIYTPREPREIRPTNFIN